jgi:hypothetical protein
MGTQQLTIGKRSRKREMEMQQLTFYLLLKGITANPTLLRLRKEDVEDNVLQQQLGFASGGITILVMKTRRMKKKNRRSQ